MNEYRVVWQQAPYCNHNRIVEFVQADSEEDAKALMIDHIERKHGISWKTIHSVTPYTRPANGRVL